MSREIKGYTIKTVNFSDKNDLKTYYLLAECIHKIGDKHGMWTPFPSPYREFLCIGHAMHANHLKQKIKYFKITKQNITKGLLLVLEVEGFDGPIFCPVGDEEDYEDIIKVSVEFLKGLGYKKLYCDIIPNHPVRQKLKLKRLVQVFPSKETPLWETWEI